MEALIILGILLGLLFLRIPVYVSLFLTGIIGILVFTDLELVFVAQTMVKKLDNFSLLCIPFFLLLGAVMVAGRSAGQLIALALRMVCFLPGGLAITSVVSSAMFGAISGSSVSTVVTIGGVMFPYMKEHNYPRSFSVGLVTTASILGMIIPPSIIMIICALTAGQSVVRLFAAGYLPSLVLMICLSLYAYITAKRQNFDTKGMEKFNVRALLLSAWKGAIPLFIIVVLFAGIYTGAFTVTEASVVACALAIVAECLIYRSVSFKELSKLMISSGILSGTLVITISGAGVLSEYITYQGIPQRIMEAVMVFVPNQFVFLIFANTVLLVIGTFMDPIASIMILIPILMPLAHQFGVDPIHFCLLVTVALGIGYVTPPLGLLLYASAAITKESFVFVVKSVMPTLAIYMVVLFVISFIPGISTFLPNLLFGP
jgi:C4-dicarboxylate transporter, DctM subunit